MSSRPRAIQPIAGAVAPASARTEIPREPSAFITTAVHCPSPTGQETVWVPEPDAVAVHTPASPGGVAGAPPGCTRSPERLSATLPKVVNSVAAR